MRVEGLVTSSAPLTLLKARDADAGSDALADVDNNEPKGDDEDDELLGRLKLTLFVMLGPEDAVAPFSPSPSLSPTSFAMKI